MHADVDIHEPQPPPDPDSPLAFSMEGYEGEPPPALIPRYWAPHWNSVQALNKFQSEVGGPLRGGDPGRRLIEPVRQEMLYFDEMPASFEPQDGSWLLVPIFHIFGSEELSVLTPGIAELAPGPYLALGPDDARELGVVEGQDVDLDIAGAVHCLPVHISPTVSKGIAGLPFGLSGLIGIEPCIRYGRIAPSKSKARSETTR
jgi:NADH-quinone oxidoreductase subunit G